jgi:hypothetical protein
MPSKTTTLTLGVSLAAGLIITMNAAAAATPASMTVGGKTYYKVTSTDATQDSGKEVCALVGKTCVGYSNLSSNAVCKAFHPTAKSVTSVNGSKAGFYCDGAPQKGLACEKFKNTCEVCPACNVNADCNTAIGQQFREMYVECGAAIPKSAAYVKPPLPGKSSSSKPIAKSSSSKSAAAKPIGPYPGNVACDFYQGPGTTKKVTCNAIKAADSFCAIAMQSRFAKAVECNDNGRIICTKPCVTNPAEVMLKQCAFDAKRPTGSQAAPFNYCTGTSSSKKQSSSAASTKKKAGAVCNHGGDCISGKCIGTGRPNNQPLYQCSCSWNSLTYGCD